MQETQDKAASSLSSSESDARPRMIVLELTGAEKHFLDKYVQDGSLPIFEKLLQKGKLLKTENAVVNFSKERGGAIVTPWAIWPSIYTGMSPFEHGIVGFGQDSQNLQGSCIWDRLNSRGITTGVFGSLIGAPMENDPKMLFYLPGIFGNIRQALPESYTIVQEFLLFSALSHTKKAPLRALHLFLKLGIAFFQGVPFAILKMLFRLIPRAFFQSVEYQKDRSLLLAQLQMEVFRSLYHQFKPAFATFHLSHIAYAQHLYWRATEPERFKDKLGELDSYYFSSLEERKFHESIFKEAILDSFKLMDQFLAQLMASLDDNTMLVIITGMGQKSYDPVHQIHKPDIRLTHIDQLLKFVDIENCEILSQMNPDITLNFENSTEASLAEFKLSNMKVLSEYPLFNVTQKENQLFLEETLPPEIWFVGEEAWIENISSEKIMPLFEFVRLSPLKDQHSAQDVGGGWMLFYGNLDRISLGADTLEITEIYPLLLGYFDDRLKAESKILRQ